MSYNRFEAISAFIHVVPPGEESSNNPLKKIRNMHDGVKRGCAKYYQPLNELSVDKRMVTSKATGSVGGGRSHFLPAPTLHVASAPKVGIEQHFTNNVNRKQPVTIF